MAFLKGNWILTLEAADLVHLVWAKVCLYFVLNARVTRLWPNWIFNYKKCHFAQSNLFVDKIIASYSLQLSKRASRATVAVHCMQLFLLCTRSGITPLQGTLSKSSYGFLVHGIWVKLSLSMMWSVNAART
jgi:hypothetical protein